MEDIKTETTTQLHSISKEKIQRCFNQPKTRWNKCDKYQKDYSEKK